MHRNQEILNVDAEKRLREVLGRSPTAKEIAQLRHGEQALGLEHPAYAKARQLLGESDVLRQQETELLAELWQKRKIGHRLRREALRTKTQSQMLRRTPRTRSKRKRR
jgi:hypothetical protein